MAVTFKVISMLHTVIKKKKKKLSLKQKVFHLFKKPWQNIEDITLCSGVYTLLLQKMFYWMSPASDSK